MLDSSAWIEIFRRGPLTAAFLEYVDSGEDVITPTIVLYEVYKVLRRETSTAMATFASGQMRRKMVVPLNEVLALKAADISMLHGLPMADAVIYATAQAYDAILVTSDVHFKDLPGVEFLAPV